ncbi:potassium channel family protein [Desulfuromonas sp. TF]|uniref:potassium channel family protein n=1 Tax=Desulfuromonas sp. TF TaxID=1232410 RepID=UPI000401B118|nr:potassium channel family protein [Desulfuromonas sp. TF]
MQSIPQAFQGFTGFWWGDRGLSAILVLLFVSLFLAPLVDSPLLRMLSTLFFSLLLISGVMNLSSRPVPRLIAGSVAAAAIALKWADHFSESQAVAVCAGTISLLFVALLTGTLLARVFRDDGQVTRYRVRGAVAAYLLVGFTFSHLYQVFDILVPGAFSISAAQQLDSAARQEDFTYFSFVTLTTLGYGDFTATHTTARMFVIMEALVGQLYPATLLARLVSLQIGGRQNSMEGPHTPAGSRPDGGAP